MKKNFRNFSLILIFFSLLFSGALEGQERTQDEKDLINTVEQFLFAAGNYNLDAMAKMMTEHANVGIARLKDGNTSIATMTFQQYVEMQKTEPCDPTLNR